MIIPVSNQSAQGRLRWQVIDAKTGRIVRQSCWIRNLIVNNGMDEVSNRTWVSCMSNASAGTGTTATSLDSGVITATQAGSAVSASAPIFVTGGPPTGDVGNYIKWDNGDERRITAVTDTQNVTVTPTSPNANGGAAGQFTIYRTNQTGLFGEAKRTSTYLTGIPNSYSYVVGNVIHHRRTYDFSVEASLVNYTEVGLAWAASGANTHFARIVLPGPVAVQAAQMLRVVYDLALTVFPTTGNALTGIITGWAVNATEQWQMFGLGNVDPNNGASNTTFDASATCNEPSVGSSGNALLAITSDSSALSTFNTTPVDRTSGQIFSGQLVLVGYSAFSFFRDKSITIAAGSATSTQIRSIVVGSNQAGVGREYRNYGYGLLLASNQTKTAGQSLVLTFRYTWSRNLA